MTAAQPGAVEELKRRAALEAVELVEPGMRLGLGSGSTAEAFLGVLGERVRGGLDVIGVPSSERTARLATELGIRLATLDEEPDLDLAVDGADEIDPRLRLIKGAGGALLREKIVASAASRMVVIADSSKLVATLGAFPLPVEVVPFGLTVTLRAIVRAAEASGHSGRLAVRERGGKPFVTDGGHLIVDASFGRIHAPEALAAGLTAVPGVVEHGLFIGIASAAIVAGAEGIERLAA